MHPSLRSIRSLATAHPVKHAARSHKIVVVGGGSAGIALSHQLLRKGSFVQDDIAIIDPAIWHHYQPGWTLVGGGLKNKKDLRRPLKGLMNSKFKFYNTTVSAFSPKENYVTLGDGDRISYEHLVVVPGIKVDIDSVKGLPEALADPNASVSSIYQYDHCDKAFRTIRKLDRGTALFTQPAGIVKCAGAPQKVMWLALDYWKRAGLYNASGKSAIDVTFATGLPTMFGVPKYSAVLNELRIERGVEGLFEHDLVAIEGNTAIFARPGNDELKEHFEFLHVAPKNRPHQFVKDSALANEAGFVDVDNATMLHKSYPNVWSIGDAASLPTSKTMAAITSQAPVVVSNLLQALQGKDPVLFYDGYTSCPLLVGDKKVLLAEFKYGGEPKETFSHLLGIDQGVPRRAFYHLKKDIFPRIYDSFHVNGTWAGPKGFTW